MEETKSDKLLLAGASLPFTEGLMAMMHGGPVGGIVALGLSGLVYVVADEMERHGRGITLPRPTQRERDPGEYTVMQKLLNGRSYRESRDVSDEEEPVTPSGQDGPWIPPQFRLEDVLDVVIQFNEQGYAYFGESESGAAAFHIDDMYHVLDVAKSGRGKSNRFRNAMMQMVNLCDTYYLNPFAAPVKSVTDKRKIEVWQPIYDRLINKHPVRESAEILQTLTGLVDEIERRSDLEQERDFSWREHPIFVFIDEVPEIRARCPEAIDYLDRIGRGGRQFGIFAWIASQSALVQDIGLSTASQAQFKTLIYGGGDKTSGNRVMGAVSAEQEKALKKNGAGLTLMIADGQDDTEYVRSPLVTNEALFAYFGLPAFQIDEWLTPKNKQSGTSNVRLLRHTQEPTHQGYATRTYAHMEEEEDSEFEHEFEEEDTRTYAHTNNVRRPENKAHMVEEERTPEYPLLDAVKVERFAMAYEITGNVDESLKRAGANSRYREHARQIIRERSLKKQA